MEEALLKSNFLLPFTAGCFLYVALCSLVPAIAEPKAGLAWYYELFMVALGATLVGVLLD